MVDGRPFGDRPDSPFGGRRPAGRDAPSDALPDALARLVEAEILPRLMLAHRAPARRARPRAPGPREVTARDVPTLAARLLAPGPLDLDAEANHLRDAGLPLPGLLLDLLTPAARHLGELWEEDACDFLAVTEALGRLQGLARRLCAQMEDEAVPPAGRSVLLVPCPGETHLFGLSVVASFFREAGWDVTVAAPGARRTAEDLLRAEWFDVVGLSLSCDVFLPALSASISRLRDASRNPGLGVLVGGAYFARHGAAPESVGADAGAADGRAAPAAAAALLDRRALAC